MPSATQVDPEAAPPASDQDSGPGPQELEAFAAHDPEGTPPDAGGFLQQGEPEGSPEPGARAQASEPAVQSPRPSEEESPEPAPPREDPDDELERGAEPEPMAGSGPAPPAVATALLRPATLPVVADEGDEDSGSSTPSAAAAEVAADEVAAAQGAAMEAAAEKGAAGAEAAEAAAAKDVAAGEGGAGEAAAPEEGSALALNGESLSGASPDGAADDAFEQTELPSPPSADTAAPSADVSGQPGSSETPAAAVQAEHRPPAEPGSLVTEAAAGVAESSAELAEVVSPAHLLTAFPGLDTRAQALRTIAQVSRTARFGFFKSLESKEGPRPVLKQ